MPEPLAMSGDSPFRREGMGYVFIPPGGDYVFRFDRVVRKSDDDWAEVVVTTTGGQHVARRKINLSGGTSVDGLVRDLKELSGGADLGWKRLVMSGAESVVVAQRSGPKLHTYSGALKRPPPLSWLCEGLIQANKVNGIIAAGGTGKSTFAMAMALHHAVGYPFLGRPMSKGTTIYLDWEGNDDDFEETLFLTASGLNLDATPPIHRFKMGRPLPGQEHWLAQKIDELGATFLVIDAVAAACGSIGDGGAGYEAVALQLEELLNCLPPITVLLLDHITSDDMKNGAVPLKARGAARKYEFVRYSWTLSLDHDAAEDGRHVVGWTNGKVNRGKKVAPFGVEVIHDDAALWFKPVERIDVGPLVERMTDLKKIEYAVKRGPLTVKEIAAELYGDDDEPACKKIRAYCSRDHGKRLVRLPDGRIASRTQVLPSEAPRNVVRFRGGDDEELPF